ncbi:MAG: hypothetical protein R3D71_00275 [Rickettsiales bacterium]
MSKRLDDILHQKLVDYYKIKIGKANMSNLAASKVGELRGVIAEGLADRSDRIMPKTGKIIETVLSLSDDELNGYIEQVAGTGTKNTSHAISRKGNNGSRRTGTGIYHTL